MGSELMLWCLFASSHISAVPGVCWLAMVKTARIKEEVVGVDAWGCFVRIVLSSCFVPSSHWSSCIVVRLMTSVCTHS